MRDSRISEVKRPFQVNDPQARPPPGRPPARLLAGGRRRLQLVSPRDPDPADALTDVFGWLGEARADVDRIAHTER